MLGLLGENGAGKSTLMNIIYGLYQPDEGEILVNGKPVQIHNPNDAIRLGIGMVHQHFQLVPVLTVTENIMLGDESTRGPVPRPAQRAQAHHGNLASSIGLEVDPDALVQDLPVGVQQRVEIIKALYRKADILILDEPTAVLTPQETEGLFRHHAHAAGARREHHLHQPQAERSAGNLRRDRRAAQRARRRSCRPRQGDARKSLAEMMVGREVLLRSREGHRRSPPSRCW